MAEACAVCGARRAPGRWLTFADLTVSFCETCGLAHIARTSIPPHYERQSLEAFTADPRAYLATHHYGIMDHLQVALGDGAAKSLLDVGCSFGAVVHAAQSRGWRATGVDTDAERIAAGSAFTAGLLVADLSASELAPASFDAVVMWHVLEHLPDPVGALRRVHVLLKPGGVLFLEVPNLGSPIAWLIYRRRWLGFETPGHLFAFTTATATAVIERSGLSVERTSRPVIAARFPGGLKGCLRGALFDALHALDMGDAVRVIARKRPV